MPLLEGYFKGLAENSRLRIVNLLLQGELCVCDIQRVLNMAQPSASRHLNYLKHAGLVLDRRDGLRVFYRLAEDDAPVLRGLYGFLREAFSGENPFNADLEQLRDSIARGACAAAPTSKTPKPVNTYNDGEA